LKLEPGQRIKSLSLQEASGIVWWDALTVSGTVEPASDPRASLLAWWKTHGTKAPPGLPGHLHGVFGLGPDKFAEAEEQQRSAFRQFYLATIARPVTPQLAIQQAAFAS